MMNVLNKPWITTLTLLAFMALALYSRHYAMGYTPKEIHAMRELVGKVTGNHGMSNAEKMIYLYGTEK